MPLANNFNEISILSDFIEAKDAFVKLDLLQTSLDKNLADEKLVCESLKGEIGRQKHAIRDFIIGTDTMSRQGIKLMIGLKAMSPILLPRESSLSRDWLIGVLNEIEKTPAKSSNSHSDL